MAVLALAVVLPACASQGEPTPTPPAGIAEVVGVWEELSGGDASSDHSSIVEVWNILAGGFVEKELLDAGAMGLAAIEAMNAEAATMDQPDPEHLSLVAIEAMLDVLDDPYTTFLSPEEFALYSQDSEGKFGGIGATVGLQDERITITAPLPGTPAERAGIMPGDVILEVDGESTEGWSVLESVIRIRGPEGTPCVSWCCTRTRRSPSKSRSCAPPSSSRAWSGSCCPIASLTSKSRPFLQTPTSR